MNSRTVTQSLNLSKSFAQSREWLSKELKFHQQCATHDANITSMHKDSISTLIDSKKTLPMNTPHVCELNLDHNPIYSLVVMKNEDSKNAFKAVLSTHCDLKMNGFTFNSVIEEARKCGTDTATHALYSEFEPHWIFVRDNIMQNTDISKVVQPFQCKNTMTISDMADMRRVQLHEGEWKIGNSFKPDSYTVKRETVSMNGRILTEQVHIEHRAARKVNTFHVMINTSASNIGDNPTVQQINPSLDQDTKKKNLLQLHVIVGLDRDILSCSNIRVEGEAIHVGASALSALKAQAKLGDQRCYCTNIKSFNTELGSIETVNVICEKPLLSLVIFSGKTKDFLVLSCLGVAD